MSPAQRPTFYRTKRTWARGGQTNFQGFGPQGFVTGLFELGSGGQTIFKGLGLRVLLGDFLSWGLGASGLEPVEDWTLEGLNDVMTPSPKPRGGGGPNRSVTPGAVQVVRPSPGWSA